MKKYQQYTLSDGYFRLTCWLESRGLKVGDSVTLPEYGPDWWKITKVYKTVLTEDKLSQGGHNSEKWYKNDFRRKIGNKP